MWPIFTTRRHASAVYDIVMCSSSLSQEHHVDAEGLDLEWVEEWNKEGTWLAQVHLENVLDWDVQLSE